MARQRMINPNWWDDPRIYRLSSDAFRLFCGLHSLAETDDGRGKFDKKYWISRVFPLQIPQKYDLIVNQLLENDVVMIYEANTIIYFLLPLWFESNSVPTPFPSPIPFPPFESIIKYDSYLLGLKKHIEKMSKRYENNKETLPQHYQNVFKTLSQYYDNDIKSLFPNRTELNRTEMKCNEGNKTLSQFDKTFLKKLEEECVRSGVVFNVKIGSEIIETFSEEDILIALQKTKNQGKRNLGYVRGILQNQTKERSIEKDIEKEEEAILLEKNRLEEENKEIDRQSHGRMLTPEENYDQAQEANKIARELSMKMRGKWVS